jgi:hypothetical protein
MHGQGNGCQRGRARGISGSSLVTAEVHGKWTRQLTKPKQPLTSVARPLGFRQMPPSQHPLIMHPNPSPRSTIYTNCDMAIIVTSKL